MQVLKRFLFGLVLLSAFPVWGSYVDDFVSTEELTIATNYQYDYRAYYRFGYFSQKDENREQKLNQWVARFRTMAPESYEWLNENCVDKRGRRGAGLHFSSNVDNVIFIDPSTSSSFNGELKDERIEANVWTGFTNVFMFIPRVFMKVGAFGIYVIDRSIWGYMTFAHVHEYVGLYESYQPKIDVELDPKKGYQYYGFIDHEPITTVFILADEQSLWKTMIEFFRKGACPESPALGL